MGIEGDVGARATAVSTPTRRGAAGGGGLGEPPGGDHEIRGVGDAVAVRRHLAETSEGWAVGSREREHDCTYIHMCAYVEGSYENQMPGSERRGLSNALFPRYERAIR